MDALAMQSLMMLTAPIIVSSTAVAAVVLALAMTRLPERELRRASIACRQRTRAR